MSRTYRKIAHANINARGIRFRSQRLNTVDYIDQLKDEEFYPRPRDYKLASRGYLNPWDDYNNAAWHESTYVVNQVDEKLGGLHDVIGRSWRHSFRKEFNNIEKKYNRRKNNDNRW